MKKKKCIVFLDIDGVIRTDKCDCNDFDKKCITIMNRIHNVSIVNGIPLQYVLSSDTRQIFESLYESQQVFKSKFCSFWPSSFTPNYEDTAWSKWGELAHGPRIRRAIQINSWLRTNNARNSVPWIVIDDMNVQSGFHLFEQLIKAEKGYNDGTVISNNDENFILVKDSVNDEGIEDQIVRKIKLLNK